MNSTSTPSRLATHDARVDCLDTLAVLMGCDARLRVFPDGTIPDVLRANLGARVLFVGDGKNTELPTCVASRDRLRHYVSWASAHVLATRGLAVIAICFAERDRTRGWCAALTELVRVPALAIVRAGVDRFGDDVVAWVAVRPT